MLHTHRYRGRLRAHSTRYAEVSLVEFKCEDKKTINNLLKFINYWKNLWYARKNISSFKYPRFSVEREYAYNACC